jgi:hypothetical protein
VKSGLTLFGRFSDTLTVKQEDELRTCMLVTSMSIVKTYHMVIFLMWRVQGPKSLYRKPVTRTYQKVRLSLARKEIG